MFRLWLSTVSLLIGVALLAHGMDVDNGWWTMTGGLFLAVHAGMLG